MYTNICHFPSFSDTSLRSRTFIRNATGGGHNSTLVITLPEVWERSVQCVARGKPFKLFLALGMNMANPRASATSPEMVFPHPPEDWVYAPPVDWITQLPRDWLSAYPPCTYIRFGCKQTAFLCYERVHVHLFPYFCKMHKATILPPSSSPAPYQQQQQPATICACRCCRRTWLL